MKYLRKRFVLFFVLPTSIIFLLFLGLPILCNAFISAFDIGNNPGQWFASSASFDNYKTAVCKMEL